jgi:hypothetical protein
MATSSLLKSRALTIWSIDRNGTSSSRSRPATPNHLSRPIIASAKIASDLCSDTLLDRQRHGCGAVTTVIRIDQHTQIPIERVASTPISREFPPWRLSDDAPVQAATSRWGRHPKPFTQADSCNATDGLLYSTTSTAITISLSARLGHEPWRS